MPRQAPPDNVVVFPFQRRLGRDPVRHRDVASDRRVDLAVVALLVLLSLGCARLGQALIHESALEDCFLSGRTHCIDAVR